MPLSVVTEKVQINANVVVQKTTKYSDRSLPENLEIKAQQLYQKATQQFQNGELETALEIFQQVLDIRKQQGDRFNIGSTLYSIATVYKQLYHVRIISYKKNFWP
ncbi:MAG: tetratricopeptide repeat protein [Okeania sp. SIO3B3]|nr:tetratricopeptide repeat protein [Okeania sp. SIO3B3]